VGLIRRALVSLQKKVNALLTNLMDGLYICAEHTKNYLILPQSAYPSGC
jgi:hypothetical protein